MEFSSRVENSAPQCSRASWKGGGAVWGAWGHLSLRKRRGELSFSCHRSNWFRVARYLNIQQWVDFYMKSFPFKNLETNSEFKNQSLTCPNNMPTSCIWLLGWRNLEPRASLTRWSILPWRVRARALEMDGHYQNWSHAEELLGCRQLWPAQMWLLSWDIPIHNLLERGPHCWGCRYQAAGWTPRAAGSWQVQPWPVGPLSVGFGGWMGSRGTWADPSTPYLRDLTWNFLPSPSQILAIPCRNAWRAKKKKSLHCPNCLLYLGFPSIVTEWENLLFKSLYVHKLISHIHFLKNSIIFMPTAHNLFNHFIHHEWLSLVMDLFSSCFWHPHGVPSNEFIIIYINYSQLDILGGFHFLFFSFKERWCEFSY